MLTDTRHRIVTESSLRRLCACGALAAVAAVAVGAQTPPAAESSAPTFKTQVEYVEVDALVVDQQGRFVRDLKKEDFDLREDGKPQAITAFSLVDIPVERALRPLFANRVVEPDVMSNERPFDGRIYVLLLDDLHVDTARTQRVRTAASQFIEQKLGANDLMAVVSTTGRTDAARDFTNNKRVLLEAVNRFLGHKLSSAALERNTVRRGLADLGGDDPDEAERLHNAESSLAMIGNVAEWFGGVRGRRKTILLFSEGLDYDITDQVPASGSTHQGAAAVVDSMNTAVGEAQRANVAIYTIDPRGLTSGGDDTIAIGSFIDGGAAGDAATRPGGQRGLAAQLRTDQDGLRRLSDETGGIASVNRNDLAPAFDRILADNSSYYVLAYYPASDKRDGRFHKIDVRLKGRNGLTVRARRGYLAARGKPSAPQTAPTGASPEVHEALLSPLPVSGLTMTMFAAPFKGAQPNASVLLGVEMDGRDFKLAPDDIVELSYVANDADGKVRGGKLEKITMKLRAETQAVLEKGSFRVLSRMDLAPGRYQVRVASHDTAGGAVGSVIYDLDVPDFYKQPFSISGLVMASLGSATVVTARADDQLREVLPTPPTAARTFPQNDELALFTEVYDNSGSAPHKVDFTTTLTSDAGKVAFKNEEQRDSSELQGQRGGYGYSTRIPLTDIEPGLYVMRVEARSRLEKDSSVAREAVIRVQPRTQ